MAPRKFLEGPVWVEAINGLGDPIDVAPQALRQIGPLDFKAKSNALFAIYRKVMAICKELGERYPPKVPLRDTRKAVVNELNIWISPMVFLYREAWTGDQYRIDNGLSRNIFHPRIRYPGLSERMSNEGLAMQTGPFMTQYLEAEPALRFSQLFLSRMKAYMATQPLGPVLPTVDDLERYRFSYPPGSHGYVFNLQLGRNRVTIAQMMKRKHYKFPHFTPGVCQPKPDEEDEEPVRKRRRSSGPNIATMAPEPFIRVLPPWPSRSNPGGSFVDIEQAFRPPLARHYSFEKENAVWRRETTVHVAAHNGTVPIEVAGHVQSVEMAEIPDDHEVVVHISVEIRKRQHQ